MSLSDADVERIAEAVARRLNTRPAPMPYGPSPWAPVPIPYWQPNQFRVTSKVAELMQEAHAANRARQAQEQRDLFTAVTPQGQEIGER